MTGAAFEWFPAVPAFYLALLAASAVLIAGVAFRRGVSDFYFRAAFLVLVLLFVLHPVLQRQARQSLPDKVVIVVDESGSQKMGGRDKVTAEALAAIEKRLAELKGFEPVVIRVPGDEETALFSTLRDRLADIPLPQVAATILITDGQVHDVPADLGVLARLKPFHALLTGSRDEFDRQVTVLAAPKYSVLDDDIVIRVRVDVHGAKDGAQVVLTSFQDGAIHQEQPVTPGEAVDIPFKLNHPGQNIFEFSVAPAEGELTAHNNTAPVIVNGVRDRLRVLLVSGSPHMGERAWRNLLKSDPAIDLVHFTILRSPNAMDPTPQNELSLIVFPVDTLFQEKIRDFDLIIFDRYQQYSLLMPEYFNNIKSFVQDGGAFLMALGTDQRDAGVASTALMDILPVRPIGRADDSLLKGAFRPVLTDLGKRHPVTADIANLSGKLWSEWYSEAAVQALRGEVLMRGQRDNPLLVLGKEGKGRVAVLSSDNVWLWSKKADGGGPYTELLRNIAHWLMKEPELEEDYIKAEAQGRVLTVSMRDDGGAARSVEMTTPGGNTETLTLSEKSGGWLRATRTAGENGIYAFAAGTRKAFAVVGTAMNAEFADVHTTAEKLAPVITATGGGTAWFRDDPALELRPVSARSERAAGDGWLGLRRNEVYAVTHLESDALLPDSLSLWVLLAALMGVWWREGRKKPL